MEDTSRTCRFSIHAMFPPLCLRIAWHKHDFVANVQINVFLSILLGGERIESYEKLVRAHRMSISAIIPILRLHLDVRANLVGIASKALEELGICFSMTLEN